MFELKNKKPHFLPLDIVQTTKGELGFIREVNQNVCQSSDHGQWTYSIEFLHPVPSGTKNAWYYANELKLTGNLYALISKAMIHPFSSGKWVPEMTDRRHDVGT